MRQKIVGIICMLLILPVCGVAQQEQIDVKTHVLPRLSYSPYSGVLLGRAPAIKRLQGIPYYGQELLMGFQTSKDDGVYDGLNAPYYGLGFHYGMYGGHEVGDVFSSFFFLDVPLWRNGKSSINTAAAMGLVLGCHRYRFADDPGFMQQSSYANVYSHISLSYHYQVSPLWDLGFGGRFQHFSNGGWQYPNDGMEMASVQLTVAYTMSSQSIEKEVPLAQKRSHGFVPVLSMGVSGSESNFTDTYLYSNLSLAHSLVRRSFYDLGAGFDLTYNAAFEERIGASYSSADALYGGIFLSQELLFRDVRLGLQVGMHVFSQVDFDLPVYERLVLRYQPFKQSFFHFGIKLNGGKSECLEWGVGLVI